MDGWMDGGEGRRVGTTMATTPLQIAEAFVVAEGPRWKSGVEIWVAVNGEWCIY